ncbi:hypothetical protein BC829DRAFT_461681 [Chytridium lagenaria]|nr:hypothetical protein BC829DRAFT_461681 [Chytridium lagenaria]
MIQNVLIHLTTVITTKADTKTNMTRYVQRHNFNNQRIIRKTTGPSTRDVPIKQENVKPPAISENAKDAMDMTGIHVQGPSSENYGIQTFNNWSKTHGNRHMCTPKGVKESKSIFRKYFNGIGYAATITIKDEAFPVVIPLPVRILTRQSVEYRQQILRSDGRILWKSRFGGSVLMDPNELTNLLKNISQSTGVRCGLPVFDANSQYFTLNSTIWPPKSTAAQTTPSKGGYHGSSPLTHNSNTTAEVPPWVEIKRRSDNKPYLPMYDGRSDADEYFKYSQMETLPKLNSNSTQKEDLFEGDVVIVGTSISVQGNGWIFNPHWVVLIHRDEQMQRHRKWILWRMTTCDLI